MSTRWSIMVAVLAGLSAGCDGRGHASWSEVWASDGEHALRAVWGTGDQGWAVGDSGTIVHFDGTTWREVISPTEERLLDVHGCSATEVWAVGDDDTVVRFDGASWRQVPGPRIGRIGAVWCEAAGEVWVGGMKSRVSRYAGGRWETRKLFVGDRDFVDAWSDGQGRIWFASRHDVVELTDGEREIIPAPEGQEPTSISGIYHPETKRIELWIATWRELFWRRGDLSDAEWQMDFVDETHGVRRVVAAEEVVVATGSMTLLRTADALMEQRELHRDDAFGRGVWIRGSAAAPTVVVVGYRDVFEGESNCLYGPPLGSFIREWRPELP